MQFCKFVQEQQRVLIKQRFFVVIFTDKFGVDTLDLHWINKKS